MIRIYFSDTITLHEKMMLDDKTSHYLCTVMRQSEGDTCLLFNEKDGEFLCEIEKAHKKKAELVVKERKRQAKASPELHLYLSPLKKNTTDFAVEKATECGVTHIHFIKTDYTNATRVNVDRLSAIAREAAEQCRRLDVPQLFDIVPFDRLAMNWPDNLCPIIAAEDGRGLSMQEIKQIKEKQGQTDLAPALFIGPEGGFSEYEFECFQDFPNHKFLDLGPLILRAETAVVVGLSLINTLDLKCA